MQRASFACFRGRLRCHVSASAAGTWDCAIRAPSFRVATRCSLCSAARCRLRPAQVEPGEKPYLIAGVGLNRAVLLEAAGRCVKFGSGGRI